MIPLLSRFARQDKFKDEEKTVTKDDAG